MRFRIEVLTKRLMETHLAELINLDKDVLGETWTESNFLRDLPGKWELSKVAFATSGKLAGFVIVSTKPESAHVHRIAVCGKCRRRGLGRLLITAAGKEVDRQDIRQMTCKVREDNTVSQIMMQRLGWECVAKSGENYLLSVDVSSLLLLA